jgi:hypothetical protein
MNIFLWAADKVRDAIAYIRKDHDNYYKFGDTDNLPNEIIEIVNDSGTARACIKRLSQFIAGRGFSSEGGTQANPQQSFNSVLGDLSNNVSYLEVVNYRVLFDNSGQPERAYSVPAQLLRRQGPNTYRYNPLMGYVGELPKDNVWLQGYDPKEAPASRTKRVSEQINKYGKHWGDIVYHFKKGLGIHNDVYSIPSYYSGINDIESDAGVSKIEKRNIKKGWRTPIIVSTGPIDHFQKDENGKTQFEKFAEVIKSFTGEDAGAVLHLEGATNEAKPVVTTIDVAEILDATDRATERVGRKVCRHMGVPPILVGFETAGQLGNVEELKNTMDLFRLSVVEYQALISDALKIAFPQRNWAILPLELWTKPVTPTNETTEV